MKSFYDLITVTCSPLCPQELLFLKNECSFDSWKDKQIPNEIFNSCADVIKRNNAIIKPVDLRKISDFCESIWWLYSKTGISIVKIFDQLNLVDTADSGSASFNPQPLPYLGFFTDYARYTKSRLEGEKLGIRLYGMNEYFPDFVCQRPADKIKQYANGWILEVTKHAGAIDAVARLHDVYEPLELAFEYAGKQYISIVPKEYTDMVAEATEMKNCLVSRILEYCNGEWLIVFIREAGNMDKSYITVAFHVDGSKAEPMYVLFKNHVDVRKTESAGIFNAWYSKVKKILPDLVEAYNVFLSVA